MEVELCGSEEDCACARAVGTRILIQPAPFLVICCWEGRTLLVSLLRGGATAAGCFREPRLPEAKLAFDGSGCHATGSSLGSAFFWPPSSHLQTLFFTPTMTPIHFSLFRVKEWWWNKDLFYLLNARHFGIYQG